MRISNINGNEQPAANNTTLKIEDESCIIPCIAAPQLGERAQQLQTSGLNESTLDQIFDLNKEFASLFQGTSSAKNSDCPTKLQFGQQKSENSKRQIPKIQGKNLKMKIKGFPPRSTSE